MMGLMLAGLLLAGGAGAAPDDATMAALASGRAVVVERDADGVARIVAESTVDRRPRVVGHGRKWMGVFETSIQIAETTPAGACDSDRACRKTADDMCIAAGYAEGVCKQGVTKATVTEYADGSKMCSGGCCGTSEHGTTGGEAMALCPGRPTPPDPKP